MRLFKEDERIFYQDKELIEFNRYDNIKNFILINCPISLVISKKDYSEKKERILQSFIPNNIRDKNNSFEICIFDYIQSFYGNKPINLFENKFSRKTNLENIFKEVKHLVEIDNKIKNDYKKIITLYPITSIEINFCQKKSILKNEFTKDEDYYLIFLYFLWYVISTAYLSEFDLKISIIELFNYICEFYNLYLEDKDLLIYEKIMLFCSHVCFFIEVNDVEIYKQRKLKYIKKKDIKNYPIYDIIFNFLNKFINGINGRSYLFLPLLMLDSGIYFNSKEKEIYGFTLESSENIKLHLLELMPDVFFEYENDHITTNKENVFNYKGYGIIFINKKLMSYKGEECDDNNKKRLFKHCAIKVAKTTMHEIFCHIKYLYNNINKISPPRRFYNKNKQLVKLVPLNFRKIKYKNNIEYFKVHNRDKGENGNFFEYFFGKYNDVLIIDLIFKIDYIGNLIDYDEYFLKEDIELLQKYIVNKYKIIENKIDYKEPENPTLESENMIMEELLDNYEKNEKLKNENKKEKSVKIDFDSKKNILSEGEISDENKDREESESESEDEGYDYEFLRKKIYEENDFGDNNKYLCLYFKSLHKS